LICCLWVLGSMCLCVGTSVETVLAPRFSSEIRPTAGVPLGTGGRGWDSTAEPREVVGLQFRHSENGITVPPLHCRYTGSNTPWGVGATYIQWPLDEPESHTHRACEQGTSIQRRRWHQDERYRCTRTYLPLQFHRSCQVAILLLDILRKRRLCPHIRRP